VRVWDVAGQVESRPALRHQGNVHGVAFSPDGQLLAAASHHGGGLTVWHLASGQHFGVGREADWVYAVAFAPDGKSLAAGDYRKLQIWQIER
jgi:WD40 repeat protein